MLRKLFALLFLLTLPSLCLAETVWVTAPAVIHPGQKQQLTFSSDGGSCSLSVTDAAGSTSYILFGAQAETGETTVWWDGRINGEALPEGECTFSVTVAGETASVSASVGGGVPALTILDAPEETASDWEALISVPCDGELTVSIRTEDGDSVIVSQTVSAGENSVAWNGRVDGFVPAAGDYDLTFRFVSGEGLSAPDELLEVTVPKEAQPQPAHDAWDVTPNADSEVKCDHELCFWNTVAGDLDEDTLWQLLTAPVTVLKGYQRDQIKVRREPDESCTEYVGEVTCDSQAVHILGESEDGAWTLIEAYSSSESGSRVAIYAKHFQGWVKTSLLEEKEVSQTYGIVIDKLQQRLYLFKEGKLYSTLLCSTGFSTESTPYNETPAGEFLIVSWTGGFWSNDMFCDYGLRINSGILLHEVPCYIRTKDDGTEYKYYSVFPDYLGEKASHGCIRIQAEKTPEGVNMRWLWDNLDRKNVKVIIWDELNRELLPADDDYVLYYNPDGGTRYHSSPYCRGVSEKYWPLTAFTYGELEEKPYSSLKRCPNCAPQLRVSEVDTVNEKNNRVW